MSDEEQLAVRVSGLEEAKRNEGLSRLVGKITAVSPNSLTLLACDGSTVTCALPQQLSDELRVGQNVEVGVGHEGGDLAVLYCVALSSGMDMDLYRQVLKVCDKFPQLTKPRNVA